LILQFTKQCTSFLALLYFLLDSNITNHKQIGYENWRILYGREQLSCSCVHLAGNQTRHFRCMSHCLNLRFVFPLFWQKMISSGATLMKRPLYIPVITGRVNKSAQLLNVLDYKSFISLFCCFLLCVFFFIARRQKQRQKPSPNFH
jgi:hypothetical protein